MRSAAHSDGRANGTPSRPPAGELADVGYNEALIWGAGGGTPVCDPMAGVVTIADGQTGLGPLAVDATYVYWGVAVVPSGSLAKPGYAIKRADKCGGEVSTLASGGGTVTWLGTEDGHLYAAIAPDSNGNDSVVHVPMQGGSVSTLVTRPVVGAPEGGIAHLALDATHVYWTENAVPLNANANGLVLSAPLTGGAATTLASGRAFPAGVAAASGQVYWADSLGHFDYMSAGSILREPVGGGVPVTMGTYAVGPLGLNATMFFWSALFQTWTPSTGNVWNAAVLSAPLAGGTVTTVMSTEDSARRPDPLGEVGTSESLVVDDSFLYFVNQVSPAASALAKVPVSGGVTTTVASAGTVGVIAIDQASIYWTSVGDGRVVRSTPK